ncbi:hypothetical protein GH733_008757 [Mirounga leonina]|nr:hypothetical protein GH733_008757 [Mirounga leonina]
MQIIFLKVKEVTEDSADVAKFKVQDPYSKKEELLKQLEDLKVELSQLHIAKVTGGRASKLSKIPAVCKPTARVLTVISQTQKENLRKFYKGLRNSAAKRDEERDVGTFFNQEHYTFLTYVLQCTKGKVGFVFTKEDLTEIRVMLLATKVPAGAVALCEVTVPAQSTGYPTVASVPLSIINGYKWVLALSAEADDTFPLAAKIQAFLADPSASVAAAPVAEATTAAPAAATAPAKKLLPDRR